jgi:hypothetical protein
VSSLPHGGPLPTSGDEGHKGEASPFVQARKVL